MGQYYYPVNLDTFEYFYTHDCGNGLKLMEHIFKGSHTTANAGGVFLGNLCPEAPRKPPPPPTQPA